MKLFIKTLTAISLLHAALIVQAGVLIPDQNEKGKWGYVDESGSTVIGYKYDEAGNFKDGRAMVKKGDNYGYIDPDGKTIIDIKYNIIEYQSTSIYRVAADGKYKDGVLFDEKYGFITTDGTVLLKPEYEEIGAFKNGMAYIKKGDNYGYINDRIEIVIPCKYKAVGSFNTDGVVWVNDGGKFEKDSPGKISGGKFGIIDTTGNIIVKPEYSMAGVFKPYEQTLSESRLNKMDPTERNITKQAGSHRLLTKSVIDTHPFSLLPDSVPGYWASKKKDGSKNAVIDRQGNIIIKEGKYRQAFYPEEGMAMVRPKNPYEVNYLDIAAGKLLFKKSIYGGWSFMDGVAVASSDGSSWYLIDKQGNKVTETYENIYPRRDGVYIVKAEAGYGLLDKQGKVILKATNSAIYPPSYGLMLRQMTKNDPIGYIDNTGQWVIEPKYRSAQSFHYGLASVMTADGWGEIDTTGKEQVKCRWKNTINKFKEGQRVMWVSSDDDSYMALDIATDSILFPTAYKWFRSFDRDYEGVALVGNDEEHVGVIDMTGKVIIPLEFTSSIASSAYETYLAKKMTIWSKTDSYRIRLYNNDARNDGSLFETLDASLWDY